MRLARHKRERQLALDMTPMIDIVFQLLIFFLVTAQMVHLSRAKLELPLEKGEQHEVDEAGLIINVLDDGSILVADRRLTMDELEAAVGDALKLAPDQQSEQAKVTIRADRKTDARHLNEVIELLHRKGVGVARIATAPPR